jgi:hypothetical protein
MITILGQFSWVRLSFTQSVRKGLKIITRKHGRCDRKPHVLYRIDPYFAIRRICRFILTCKGSFARSLARPI